MDSTIHNVLLDLKILSMVEPKGRLCLINGVLAVEPQTFWLPVKRYIWNIDRNILYQRIKQRALELETLFIQQMINEDWIKEEITKLIEPVRNGIRNLKETYATDSQMCAYLDLIVSRFNNISKTYL